MKRSFWSTFLIIFFVLVFFTSLVYAQISIEVIRKDLRDRSSLTSNIWTFGDGGSGYARYVQPDGIVVLLYPSYSGYGILNQKTLNDFFSKIGEAFAATKYPPDTKFNIYVELGKESSLVVRFPAKVMYDFFKEKITRSDFLKQCEIWINGEKAIVEGDIIKVSGGEFMMSFRW